jgi:hypothetical protein
MPMTRQTDTGELTIRCTSNNNAIPIQDAHVSVFLDNDDGNPVSVGDMYTDNSGRTEEIPLFAPPIDYSLTPDSPKPYSTYNVRADAGGFQPFIVRNVQVLPGTLAIQECDLRPITDEAETEEVEEITILPHTLRYDFPPKEPEDMVKPLPAPTGFVVLDKVVVPEFIIVHDGDPNAWARQFWVPYRDYVKNVASSEIYANWPRECLKANILAINSFTLNRVFTEIHRYG